MPKGIRMNQERFMERMKENFGDKYDSLSQCLTEVIMMLNTFAQNMANKLQKHVTCLKDTDVKCVQENS